MTQQEQSRKENKTGEKRVKNREQIERGERKRGRKVKLKEEASATIASKKGEEIEKKQEYRKGTGKLKTIGGRKAIKKEGEIREFVLRRKTVEKELPFTTE